MSDLLHGIILCPDQQIGKLQSCITAGYAAKEPCFQQVVTFYSLVLIIYFVLAASTWEAEIMESNSSIDSKHCTSENVCQQPSLLSLQCTVACLRYVQLFCINQQEIYVLLEEHTWIQELISLWMEGGTSGK